MCPPVYHWESMRCASSHETFMSRFPVYLAKTLGCGMENCVKRKCVMPIECACSSIHIFALRIINRLLLSIARACTNSTAQNVSIDWSSSSFLRSRVLNYVLWSVIRQECGREFSADGWFIDKTTVEQSTQTDCRLRTGRQTLWPQLNIIYFREVWCNRNRHRWHVRCLSSSKNTVNESLSNSLHHF